MADPYNLVSDRSNLSLIDHMHVLNRDWKRKKQSHVNYNFRLAYAKLTIIFCLPATEPRPAFEQYTNVGTSVVYVFRDHSFLVPAPFRLQC